MLVGKDPGLSLVLEWDFAFSDMPKGIKRRGRVEPGFSVGETRHSLCLLSS